ncbi:MAG: Unknown protein [uncultured Sulfurovum sp.]|uniref:Uncharacterized protein n=1 Tax=uncultured Sulfurovum sp. TaxID=269237 RepID=A0A6S6U9A6_9BACT|nr:MAG: Unknown protein [uncultured Sulfurovum sp.]
MQEEHQALKEPYSLEIILSTITTQKNNTAKKRLIFDQGPLSGIASKWVILFILSLPIMLYAGIFNPVMFEILGIAQAIIFFVVFLSMVMIIIVVSVFINNNKVLREVSSSWNTYFPNVDLKLALSSSATPYKDFFKHYNTALSKNLSGQTLQEELAENFATMEVENQALMNAIRANENKR